MKGNGLDLVKINLVLSITSFLADSLRLGMCPIIIIYIFIEKL